MHDSATPQPGPSPIRAHGRWRFVPGLAVLRSYQRAWLLRDLVAGVVLTAILVPTGMGYAAAAGLPPIVGLYATMIPMLVYALLGPSRILVVGPDSSLVALIAATVVPLSGGDPVRAVVLAGMLSIMAGGLCILAGIARLGFLTDLISTPIRYGYLNGIALTVLVGQLPKVLGFSVSGQSLLDALRDLAGGIAAGRVNWAACAFGLGCLAVILICKRWMPRIPGVLVAVVAAGMLTALFNLPATAGLAVVGVLPQGLPTFQFPGVALSDMQALLAGALAIALVASADMSILTRTFAMRNGGTVDSNQELIALGTANLASGMLQGFAVSSSSSRTPVAEAAGAQTQLAGVVGAGCIALLLLVAPALLESVPQAALGAVVIAACLGLIEIPRVVRLYRLRRGEFVIAITCFLGVALLGVIQGIFLAVGLALAAFIWRAWRPYDAVLGRVDGLKGYHDITRHPEARQIPGLVLFRWDAPLFFANAEIFRQRVLHVAQHAPTPTAWVVIAAEPITDVDLTAADLLMDLDQTLQTAGIELCFAEMKGPVKDLLKRYGMFHTLGDQNFFPTLGVAVDRYVETHPVEWRDWEDAPKLPQVTD